MSDLTLVMPLRDGAPHLPFTLPPLEAAFARGEFAEMIVVDDGSLDGGAELCRQRGHTVLATGGAKGPGAARNVGVAHAKTSLVLFVDADVVMHPEVPRRAAEVLADLSVVAVFGSYDDRPSAPGLVSRWRNLLHHHVHQVGLEEAGTFWAGLGAIRVAAFRAVGGFDVARFPLSSIEDIDLGYRLLAAGGRIRLRKDLQGTHRKRWTLRSMIATDVGRRAIPWARLLLSGAGGERQLNVRRGEQIRALLAGFLLLSLLAAIKDWRFVPSFVGLFSLAGLASARFHSRVAKRLGWIAILPSVALHQVYYAYSAAAYGWCRFERLLRRS